MLQHWVVLKDLGGNQSQGRHCPPVISVLSAVFQEKKFFMAGGIIAVSGGAP